MNRRQMLLKSAGAMGSVFLGSTLVQAAPLIPEVESKKYKWFTHQELMSILNVGPDTLKKFNLKKWKDKSLNIYEEFYLEAIRMSNILHRKTMGASTAPWWMVMSPQMCEESIWYPWQFGELLPQKPVWGKAGEWIMYKTDKFESCYSAPDWRKSIKEEVSPGIYCLGTMNNRWKIYVDEKFPKKQILWGVGFKQVTRFKYDPIEKGFPKIVTYLGPPTRKHYGLSIDVS
jgi:hypothetical protein